MYIANKKSYLAPPEVKADILKRVKEEGVSVAQAAKDHGIHETTIYRRLGVGAKGTPSWSEFSWIQKQNKELFALVGELTVRLSGVQKKC